MWEVVVTGVLSAVLTSLSYVTGRLSYNRHVRDDFWEIFYTGSMLNLVMAVPVLLASFLVWGVPSGNELAVALLYGLISATFSSALFSYSVKECGSVVSGSASLSVEPLTAVILGAVAVGEKIGYTVIVSVALFPVIAYLLYRGSTKHEKNCGYKSLIGVFTGAWASVTGVIFSYLVSIGLAHNPVLFYVGGLIARLLIFSYPARHVFRLSIFKEVPSVLYLSAFLGVLGISVKMLSLTFKMPGHTIILVLLYPAFNVVFSHLIKETAEPINRYTVSAVILSMISALLVSI